MKQLSTSNFINLFNLLGVFNFCLLLAVSASLLISSPKPSNAEELATTVTASAGSSVYYASISNSDNVTIPVTPTNTQEEYISKEEDSRIIFSSTCPKGSYVYINTNSTNDNALTRTGSDTGKKTIEAVAGDATSGLTDNTWGFKVNGKAFSQVPVSTSPAVLYESTKVETNTPIDVLYGVKVDNNLPSGTYTNDVVYTVAVKPECLQYTLSFMDEDGTTKLYDDINVNYGDKVDLTKYTPTKTGYTFAGWSNGSSIFSGNTNPNPDNDMEVMLKAKWTDIRTIDNISYMQDISSLICNNTTIGMQKTLTDKRDNETYTVLKAKDGKCWMTQNLRIVGPKTLTTSTSDVKGNFVLPASGSTYAATLTSASVFYSGNRSYGMYYNYYTATAGTISGETNDTTEAQNSICPKNWKLATVTEQKTLLSAYNVTNDASGSAIMRSAPLNFVYSGVIYGGDTPSSQGVGGHYFSASPKGRNDVYIIVIHDNYAMAGNGGNGMSGGRSIRCVAR